jgi:predicted metal-binding membrane protein
MGMTMNMSWSIRDVFFAFVMWAVMMVAMMVPSVTPLFRLFASANTARAERSSTVNIMMFGLGYVTVWLGFSVLAALMQLALHEAALLSSAMSIPNPYLAATILIGAGAFQFTPLKRTCLTQCRSPLDFLMRYWRSGRSGAFLMGLRHGTFCLGCCWAVMLVLFVVGIMNLAWVAVLAVFILIEKVGPYGGRVGQIAGTIMIAFGGWLWMSAGV